MGPKRHSHLLMAYLLLLLSLFLPTKSESVSLLKKNPWCDRWFQRSPREFSILKENLKGIRKVRPWSERGTLNAEYHNQIMTPIMALFKSQRYMELDLDIKSRMISYVITQWIYVSRERSSMVIAVANWLTEVVSTHDFSQEQLQRIRQSFNIFLMRQPGFMARQDGFDYRMDGTMFGVDTALTFVASFIGYMSTGTSMLIPIPIAMTIFSGIRGIQAVTKNPLSREAREHALNLEKLMCTKLNVRIPLSDIQHRWMAELKLVQGDHGSIANAGQLKLIFEQQRELILKHMESDQNKKIAHIVEIVKSLEAINPVDWQEIVEVFGSIWDLGHKLNLSETEVQPILNQIRSVSDKWGTNARARKAVFDLLAKNWKQTALPGQE